MGKGTQSKKKTGVKKRAVRLAMDSAWSPEARNQRNKDKERPKVKKHKTMNPLGTLG
jgi:hypothetical protein